jgi:hypothetical protein
MVGLNPVTETLNGSRIFDIHIRPPGCFRAQTAKTL